MYSYDEALEGSIEYFDGDELAAKVFVDKYALRNNNGDILEKTPYDMHKRLAKEFARIEKKKFKKPLSESKIFNLFNGFKYIVPQGSPMTAIGNPYYLMSISNCFVVEPPEDSYGGIHKADEELSQISKRRGGVGIDISKFRPSGTPTKNSSKTSSGIIPFLERYSNSIREVGQGGRRGALMVTLSVHHPEVLDFARVKLDRTKVTGANISIRLSDEFLKAVEADEVYEQRWPVNSKNPQISKLVNAREVWNEIIKCAHEMAEPGLLFWDNILRESPADCYPLFITVCTNPCSELPLCSDDSCRLILQNLISYVIKAFTKDAYIDFKLLYEHAQLMQRLADDMIDIELEQIDKIIAKIKSDPEHKNLKRVELELWQRIRVKCESGRRTGCGITGLADALAALGVKYGSEESIQFVDQIYKTIKFGCYRSSVDMAEELGPFSVWDKELEKNNIFLNRIKEEDIEYGTIIVDNIRTTGYLWGEDLYDDMQKYGRRNISLLTTAPAGTVSIETQTSSGIEPVFMLSYTRRKKINHNDKDKKVDFVDQSGDKWEEFTVYHPQVKKWMDITGEIDITKSPWYGCCAADIDWTQRVKLQAAAQKHVDHGISSTINLPQDVTVDKVKEIYETAWKSGLKGITVYREGCRDGVLVTDKKGIKKNNAPERPKELECDVHHLTVRGKPYFVLIGKLNGEPYEVFAGRNGIIEKNVKIGKIIKVKKNFYKAILDDETELSPVTLGCDEHEEALTRMTSMVLRHGANIEFVVEQLGKVEGDFTNFAKSIARTLKKYIPHSTISSEECPDCNVKLVYENGCQVCKSCGFSKCS